MRRKVQKKVEVIIAGIRIEHYFIATVGLATFFFGFAGGAILNLVMLYVSHPLVTQFRAVLSYKSAILGDGVILPIVNMVATAFLLKNTHFINEKLIKISLTLGILITAFFHINQAVYGMVNWSMPAPWHWNVLGLWHAAYMFCVASFLSLFYLVLAQLVKIDKSLSKDVAIVTFGLFIFLVLLRLDYITVDLLGFISTKP